jgi:hypothetical protein
MVLTAAAFTFLQLERRRSSEGPRPTLPAVRAWMREIVAIQYFVGNDQVNSYRLEGGSFVELSITNRLSSWTGSPSCSAM